MPDVLRAFKFDVRLFESQESAVGAVGNTRVAPFGIPLSDGGFQECTGLEVEADVKEYLEGGRNDEVIRRVGRIKLQPIVLKRGMFMGLGGLPNMELWNWFQSVISGERPVRRYDGIIALLSPSLNLPLVAWSFWRALPLRLKGPTMNAETGQIAIEELHLQPEALRPLLTV